jgi:choline dehydrogenase
VTEDYNGTKQEGFGAFDATIHKGSRWSAAKAYLKPALAKGKVRLKKCEAHKLRFDGKRCVGVETSKGFVKAHKEVIVSASAFNSPKLLMLSGIGPAAHLQEHGIEVIADRPGSGRTFKITLSSTFSKPVLNRSRCSNIGRYGANLKSAWSGF